VGGDQGLWKNSVTQLVIDAVNKMAAKQGIKSLKVQNRRKSEFLPRVGLQVDYDNNNETTM
jgi:hypothetical protein